DALQNHVTVQSSATGAGGASLVLVCPGTSQGSIRDRWHTHVSVASTSTQQPKFHVALTMRSALTWVCNPPSSCPLTTTMCHHNRLQEGMPRCLY
ncbi:hypothetical protein HaLaN_30464, partial [Haematococcus lacustris]